MQQLLLKRIINLDFKCISYIYARSLKGKMMWSNYLLIQWSVSIFSFIDKLVSGMSMPLKESIDGCHISKFRVLNLYIFILFLFI